MKRLLPVVADVALLCIFTQATEGDTKTVCLSNCFQEPILNMLVLLGLQRVFVFKSWYFFLVLLLTNEESGGKKSERIFEYQIPLGNEKRSSFFHC